MMIITKSAVLATVGILLSINMQAQTADEIISNHINAIGGKEVLSSVKSVYLEGTADAAGGQYPTKTTILAGKAMKNETDINGTVIMQCVTDTSGWIVNQFAGIQNPAKLPADAVLKGQSSLSIGGFLFNFKEKGFTDSLAGRENINGVNAYKIKLSKPGLMVNYLIDPTTWYILQSEIKTGDTDTEESNTKTYANYKKTDAGYVVPSTMEMTNTGYHVTFTYTTIEINKAVDPSIFAMPK